MDAIDFRKNLGERLRTVRKAQGLSQDKLAKMIGGTSDGSYVSRIENEKVGISVDGLFRIAEALDVKLSDLLDFEKAASSIIRK
ncbi:helix-turn-helix domain-containing protein [Gordonibacter urolithinfaciens]|uniref:Helix-turn-helix domain-containing protein n=1 Tax=Gordonibacter urolithinfaciens TaxID=1335613 RepID=A0A6N8IK34_9ACTN|nr:helix-turn-helix transcriptional regulator [Gordonibacter urolithinfaciens]MVM55958.1 helix-turn-helix domain-containing protein [Gordonibacter urolithinfaciens]MVN16082.1 helix-turn-helix domain-containing protein [Gordonibacter urolithinfaciens]MVN39353.1 helix-turn-helix domain-containing protein [Gordonibacter urolithinfaciens]MVN56409.1 helix-turn-helix domain-containing protein [Gordonibacter urolithinfaciens]MVN62182.1 helix-turn-helix domain-containing protein [Gordonibacter urolith